MAEDRASTEHEQPLLDPVVVVVRPDPASGFDLVDTRADPLGADQRTQPRTAVGDRPTSLGLVKVANEQVHLAHAGHALRDKLAERCAARSSPSPRRSLPVRARICPARPWQTPPLGPEPTLWCVTSSL